MKISARVDYACRAILELAKHWPNEAPLHVVDIADRQKVPIKFLPHILIHLKQLGFVQSVRGKKGGYILAKPPQEIKLSDIVKNFSEMSIHERVSSKKNDQDVFKAVWQQIDSSALSLLDSISFGSICEREKDLRDIPTYTI